jgi:hypothetical protein
MTYADAISSIVADATALGDCSAIGLSRHGDELRRIAEGLRLVVRATEVPAEASDFESDFDAKKVGWNDGYTGRPMAAYDRAYVEAYAKGVYDARLEGPAF